MVHENWNVYNHNGNAPKPQLSYSFYFWRHPWIYVTFMTDLQLKRAQWSNVSTPSFSTFLEIYVKYSENRSRDAILAYVSTVYWNICKLYSSGRTGSENKNRFSGLSNRTKSRISKVCRDMIKSSTRAYMS